MKKLNLDQLQVKSFVTTEQQEFIKGMAAVGENRSHNSHCATYDVDENTYPICS